MKTNQLILFQTDSKLRRFRKVENQRPVGGWIYTIRTALGMSMRQLGLRLKITPQGIRDIEERERNGSITISTLEEIGEALNMKFVYGFVPKSGTLKSAIDKRAHDMATKIVRKTSQNMKLEKQGLSKGMLNKAIMAKSNELKQANLKSLWE